MGKDHVVFNRTVALLSLCQALRMTVVSLLVVTSPLVGLALAPHPAMATIPFGMMFMGNLASTLPASFLMKRFGRLKGLVSGALVGAIGGWVSAKGIADGSFLALCAGAALIGVFSAFGQFYRFVAVEAAGKEQRTQAIALVVAGGILAAFAGPAIAIWTREAWSAPFLATYAALTALCVASAALLLLIKLPPAPADESKPSMTRFAEILRRPVFLVSISGSALGYGVMGLIMISTPLAMHGHGFAYTATAFVIQWHLIAMYAPAFVTGHLIRRFGVLQVMSAGGVLLLMTVAINMTGTSHLHFAASLVLLGVGWSLLYVGGTDLLSDAHTPPEKAKAQGLSEFLIFAVLALASFAAAPLERLVGWSALNAIALPFVLVTLAAPLYLAAHRGRAARAR